MSCTKSRILLFITALLCTMSVFALGTPEGTEISNWGSVSYTGSRGIHVYNAVTDTTVVTVGFEAAVLIAPDSVDQTGYLETTVSYYHRIENVSNGNDTLDVTAVSSHGWPTTIQVDFDNDSIPDGPYTPSEVLMDSVVYIIVNVEIGNDMAFWGETDIMTVTVTSRRDPAKFDEANDYTLVVGPNLDLTLVADPATPDFVAAGDTITYTLDAHNAAGDTSRPARSAIFVAERPIGTTFADTTIFPADYTLEYFSGGWAGVFDANADSIRFLLDNADSIEVDATNQFVYYALTDTCVSDTIRNQAFAAYVDSVGPHQYADTSNIVTTRIHETGVDITVDTLSLNGNIGDTLDFQFTITNNGTDPDVFTIDLDSLYDNGDFWSGYEIFLDADCDGFLSVSERAVGAITETPSLDGGQDTCIIVSVTIPDTDFCDSTMIIVQSVSNTCFADTSYSVGCINIPIMMTNMNIEEDDAPQNDTLTMGEGALPDSIFTYVIKYWNVGTGDADSFTVLDSIDANTVLQGGLNISEIVRTYPAGFTPGDFTVEYWDGSTSTWNTFASMPAGDIDTGFPMVIRFVETAALKTIPSVAAPLDPETETGQGEFIFKVRIR